MRDYLSVSQISTYLGCSLKYYFRYVEERPSETFSSALAFGKAVHATLESFHKSLLQGEPLAQSELHDLFRADLSAELSDPTKFKEKESPDSFLELGQALISEYLSTCRFEVEAVEQPFLVPLVHPESGEVLTEKPLHGFYDLLTPEGIVELKTSRSAPSEDLKERRLQLLGYSYAYEASKGKMPKLTLVSLLKQKKPRVEITSLTFQKNDLLSFLYTAKAVERGIKEEIFAPNIGWQCSNCEFAGACRSWPSTETTKL
jgi:CRISPR/Cas system-associated exonuclease Cas4 (RecB family)